MTMRTSYTITTRVTKDGLPRRTCLHSRSHLHNNSYYRLQEALMDRNTYLQMQEGHMLVNAGVIETMRDDVEILINRAKYHRDYPETAQDFLRVMLHMQERLEHIIRNAEVIQ